MLYKYLTRKNVITMLFFLYSSICIADKWVNIPGIPNPEFGITNESPARPTNWNSDIPGFYYIDNTHAKATNESTYGNPLIPRKNIPNPIPAGSVIEVHGLYDVYTRINSLGTVDKPVYVKGLSTNSPAIFSNYIEIKGSHFILENFVSKAIVPEAAHPVIVYEGSEYITIRNGEISGVGSTGRRSFLEIGTWGYSGSDKASNILVYKMNIHDLGDRNATYDQDAHGIMLHGTVENVWILENTMYKLSGDGVQIEAQHYRGNDKIQKIYIGKNIIYDNKQTGVWIKHAKKVVVSSNTIYGMTASDSSSGQCTGYQYSSDNFWFIKNTLYDCAQGIMAASDDGSAEERGNAYYIANLIYNINSHSPSNPHQAGGVTIRMPGTNHYVVGNTIDDTDFALAAPISSGKLFVYNNIFSNRNEPNNSDIYVEIAAENSEIDHNIFHSESDIKITWNNTYSSLEKFKTGTSKCSNCVAGDPGFIDTVTGNYNLGVDSPGINMGLDIELLIFSAFQEAFDFDLSLDNNNFSVPMNEWDIGAFEANENTTITKPVSPSNVSFESQSN